MDSIDDCIDDLIGSFDSLQWRNLAILRGKSYPYTLQDKRTLIESLMVDTVVKMRKANKKGI